METLLGMCVQGSVMIAAVLLVRAALGRWVSSLACKVTWGLVLVRLLIPFAAISPWLGRVEISPVAGGSVDLASASAAAQAGILGLVLDGTGVLGDAAGAAEAGQPFGAIWFLGALGVLLGFIALYARGIAKLARAPFARDERLLGWAAGAGLGRTLRIRESADLSSPVTYGLVRPVVVVPRGYVDLTPWSEVEMALRHELAHVRMFDVLFKAALACVASLYWFNPLVWAMYVCANRDLELCCDERVLRRLSCKERAQYASMLVDACARRVSVPATAGFAAHAVERRVAAVLRGSVPRVAAVAASLALAISFLGSFAVASTVAPVASALPGRPVSLKVDNGFYSFALPQCWTDHVSVRADGTTTWVYLTEYPDVWLLRFDVVDEANRYAGYNNTGCALLFEGEVAPGYYVQLRGLNYLNLSRGDLWRTAYSANPNYPGEEGEALAVALCTGYALDVETVRAMEPNPAENMEGFAHYIESVVPTVEICQGYLFAAAE